MTDSVATPGPDDISGVESPTRVEAVRATGLLEHLDDDALMRFSELAATMLGAQQCSLCLVLPERQVFATRFDMGAPGVRETPLEYSYCQYVIESGEPMAVEDAREHPLLADNPAIVEYNSIAYMGHPLRSPEGELIGTFCVIDTKPRAWTAHDMQLLEAFTGLVAAELHLRVTRSKATTDASTAFLASAVHELRTPLTSISGFASTLAARWNDFEDFQRLEFVTIIDEQSARLSELFDDLLTRAQLDSGMLEPRPEVVSPSAVLARVARQFHTVEVVVRGDAELQAIVDRGQLEQVLANLVSNALKYGAPPLEVEVSSRAGWVTISVTDHGAGVDEAFRPHLFDRFAQDANRKHAKGSGLGLWIVDQLMRQNGGTCHYEQREGAGATFVIELPSA